MWIRKWLGNKLWLHYKVNYQKAIEYFNRTWPMTFAIFNISSQSSCWEAIIFTTPTFCICYSCGLSKICFRQIFCFSLFCMCFSYSQETKSVVFMCNKLSIYISFDSVWIIQCAQSNKLFKTSCYNVCTTLFSFHMSPYINARDVLC